MTVSSEAALLSTPLRAHFDWFVESWNPLLQNVVAAAITAMLTVAVQRCLRTRRIRRRGALWRRMNGKECLAVVADHSGATGPQWEWGGLMGTGDARAYAFLANSMNEIGISLDIRVATDSYNLGSDSSDVVLIGGPDVNLATNLYMRKVGDSLAWHFPGADIHRVAIVDKLGGQTYAASSRAGHDGELAEDYGLITVTRSPFRRDGWIVCVSGCFGPGTDAAAHFTSDPRLTANKVVRSRSPFQALVRASILNRAIQAIELVEVRPLTDIDVVSAKVGNDAPTQQH